MQFSDTVLGAFLVAFAVLVGGYAQTFPAIPGQDYGAALFPMLVAMGLAICGIVLMVHGLRTGHPHLQRAEWLRTRRAGLSVLAAVLGVIGYIVIAPVIGFVPVMTLLLFGLFVLLRVRWPAAVLLAAASTIVIDGVFSGLLLVPLPLGLFPRIPW
jgi:Co/Zn/Cd efflux system component